MQYSRSGFTRVHERGRITILDLLATLLLIQPRIRLAFWAVSGHCCVMLSISSTTAPKTLFSGLPSIHSLLSLYLCLALLQTVCRTLHSGLLNFMRFAQAHLSNLPRSLWMASLPFSVLTIPHSLVSLTIFLRVNSILLSMSPTEMLDSAAFYVEFKRFYLI